MRTRAWWIWLAFSTTLSIVWAVGIRGFDHPLSGWVNDRVFISLPTELFAPFVIVGGAFMHLRTTRQRLPWFLFAAAVACFYVGGQLGVYYKNVFGIATPYPSASDVLYVSFYLLVIAGIWLLDRSYDPKRNYRTIVDGLVLGLSVVLLSLLLAPDPPSEGTNFFVLYPALDISIIGMMVHLVNGSNYLNVARLFLFAAFSSLMLGDVMSGYLLLQKAALPFNIGDQFYSFCYVFLGAAALHPQMAAVGDSRLEVHRRRRMDARVLWFVVLFLAPALLFAGALRIWVPYVYGMAILEMAVLARPESRSRD